MGDAIVIQISDGNPRWLKLSAAARYSGLGRHLLKKLAEQKTISGARVRVGRDPETGRRDWIFDRFSIDAYLESQIRPAKIADAVNRISAEMGL